MKILRSTLIAALSLGVASPTLVACAEKPGTKKKDDAKDKKKSDAKAEKKDGAKEEKKKE